MTDKRRSRLEQLFAGWNASLSGYLARRPHRTFRRTLRRDYMRSFAMPGYVGLTRDVFAIIGKNWRLFGLFFVVYAFASALILGAVDQTNYTSVVDALKSSDPNVWFRSVTLFGAAITGGLNPSSSANGQAVSVLLALLSWLTLIWLLRHVVNGKRVTLREGIYNAGAPIIPTALVFLVGLVQSIPLVLVAIGYSAASATGLLNQGIEAMLFFGAAVLLVLLSLYWLTSTFIAMVVVTLPGMYPIAALRAAGDLAVGRRLRLLLRLIWLAVVVLLMWAIILFPIILLDTAVHISWLPLVPVTILCLSGLTLVLSSAYIYVLYRKLVEDDAKPA